MNLLEQLNIKHPIFLAPMAGVSTAKLAAEVADQGGLGALGLGASSISSALQHIQATQALTTAAFQVNFFCHQTQAADAIQTRQWLDYIAAQFPEYARNLPRKLECIYPSFLDNDDFLQLILHTRPKAVSFHFGIPHPHQIQALKQAGILTMVTATNLPEARAIEAAGIDVIIAQGIEAGGHRGIFVEDLDAGLSTCDLVELLRRHCTCPIVATGGIMNGRQAAQMLDLGPVQYSSALPLCSALAPMPAPPTDMRYFNNPLPKSAVVFLDDLPVALSITGINLLILQSAHRCHLIHIAMI